MKTIDSFIIAGGIILIFIGGYFAGASEAYSRSHVLPKSQWDEVHAYRVCMYDQTCKMFVAVKK